MINQGLPMDENAETPNNPYLCTSQIKWSLMIYYVYGNTKT